MRKVITTGAAIVAALALTGCSSVIDDHSYHPAPDPMALALPFILLMLLLGMLIAGCLVPTVLDHARKMREIDARAAARHAELAEITAALQLAGQTGWPYELALQQIRAAQAHHRQLGAPRIH